MITKLIRSSLAIAATSCLLLSCGEKRGPQSGPVDYSARVGVAVRTESRTCAMFYHNDTIAPQSPVTLVLPMSPQGFVEAAVSGPSPSACPIAEEVPAGSTSYEISLPKSSNFPKLTALIAVAGSASTSGFYMENVRVEADLDQVNGKNTFRACGANDGTHLSIWRGMPLEGTLLWKGHFFQPGNPGTLPSCTAVENPLNR